MARLDEASERSVERVRVGEDGDRDRRRGIAVLCVIVAVAVGFGIWALTSGSGVEIERSSEEDALEPSDPAPEAEEGEVSDSGEVAGDAIGEAQAVTPEPAPTTVKVHVDGAVLVPGVYEVYGEDPRVADAVAAAGGLADEADTSAVNLAAQVHDADKVHIPRIEEAATPVASVGEVPAGSSTTTSAVAPSDGGSAAQASGPININTATAEELTALPGVGEKTAEKIVADRDAQGPFASIEDLMRVSGIGEKKFAQVRDLICV